MGKTGNWEIGWGPVRRERVPKVDTATRAWGMQAWWNTDRDVDGI